MSGRNFAVVLLVLVVAAFGVQTAQAQANDTCATAMAIGDGIFPGSLLGATTGPDPVVVNCGFNNGPDVWYEYTAPCTGAAIAQVCTPGSANFDTVMGAWSGTCGSLTPITCNDDTCNLQSQIVFPVSAGTIYYISVAGFNGSTGTFNLSVSCNLAVQNDACVNAIAITEGVVTAASNLGSTTGPDPVGSCGGMANDVWFVFMASCSGGYSASTCSVNTSYDTVATVWDGTAGCGGLVELACNDDNCGIPSGTHFLNSNVTWTATAGTVYYVSVGGFFGATGAFDLLVSSGGAATLAFISSGTGSLGYQVTGGPPNGAAFTAITLNGGAYPNGWFYGIDLSFPELSSEINLGFPFSVGLPTCGSAVVGPFNGLPSGLTVYGVSLGFAPAASFPSTFTPPATGTVP